MQSDAPTNGQSKEIQTWCTKILTKTQRQALTKTIPEVKRAVQEQIPNESARMEALRLGLIEYGCPVLLCSKFDKDGSESRTRLIHPVNVIVAL